MGMDIRYGRESDFEWLQENDKHVDSDWVARCLKHNEYVLAADEIGRKGFLRFSMLWGRVPYMDLVWVLPSERRKGVGGALFEFWQQEMKKRGGKMLMTSSVIDELEPQRWHRQNGFRESGQLTFGQFQTAPEIFFAKDLI